MRPVTSSEVLELIEAPELVGMQDPTPAPKGWGTIVLKALKPLLGLLHSLLFSEAGESWGTSSVAMAAAAAGDGSAASRSAVLQVLIGHGGVSAGGMSELDVVRPLCEVLRHRTSDPAIRAAACGVVLKLAASSLRAAERIKRSNGLLRDVAATLAEFHDDQNIAKHVK